MQKDQPIAVVLKANSSVAADKTVNVTITSGSNKKEC